MKSTLVLTLLCGVLTAGCQTPGTEPMTTAETSQPDEQDVTTTPPTIVIPSEMPVTEEAPKTASSLKAQITVPSEQPVEGKEALKAQIYIPSEDS